MKITKTENLTTSKFKILPQQKAILEVLLYFDIFTYPLTIEEINQFCTCKIQSYVELNELLHELHELNLIKKHNHFYHLNDDHNIIEKRVEGNKLAEEILVKAYRYGKLIAKFPFVNGVYISGSLSKGYADKKSDVDFFIITEPTKLWICRTFLVAYKKLVLLNSRKYFCVNYFIDANSLEISDKNIFTATEISSLLPVSNSQLYNKFMQQNNWIRTLQPNGKNRLLPADDQSKPPLLKKIIEKALSGKVGNALDILFFKITLKRWKNKFSHFNIKDFDLNMRSKKNVSKHHPNGFQQKVLQQHQQKIANFESRHQITLSNG